jgi:hypothetical protein
MKPVLLVLTLSLLIIMPGWTTIAGDLQVCADDQALRSDIAPVTESPDAPEGTEEVYVGTVRVYLVEPRARWTDDQGYFYRHGFLDFPIIGNVNLWDGDTRYMTDTWDATTSPMQWIFEDNIMAMGVIFRSATVLTDADPPSGTYFAAHYADAAAGAVPGFPGQNQTSGGFTHTVFIEEATATW